MAKVLIVGCGDLGGEVAKQLSILGIETLGLRRSKEAIDGVTIIQADVTQPSSLSLLNAINPEVLIYCVAANGQTDVQYKTHYVDGLHNVLATQTNNLKLKHVFFVSSTRVYGQKTDLLLNERTLAKPSDFGGERMLEAENLLSKLLNDSQKLVNTTILRLSGIYGPGRLRMINLARSPEKWPTQDSWTNRIHRDDAAAFMVFLTQQVLADAAIKACYIVTDSKPSSQYEVLTWIANKMQIKIESNPPPIEDGKRLSNQAMLDSGFSLRYPDYASGYQALLAEINTSQN